jgi:predicted permease
LLSAGLLSRKTGALRSGDERVLSAYLYYFALPALLFVNTAEIEFAGQALRFLLAGMAPVLAIFLIYILSYIVFKFSKDTVSLLILSTFYGNLAFFGIPFIMFAFPERQAEHLAILSVVSISIVSIVLCVFVLELYSLGESALREGVARVLRRFSTNPLIIAILAGIALSLIGVDLPRPVSTPLHMLGGTTATIGIFMLGVFLHGRRYAHLWRAFRLSLLRMVFLPLVALVVMRFFELTDLEGTILVLMHAMPVGISLIVLSERYDFYKETIASLILISSLGAAFHLNVWLLVLGYH